jgi:hypothetical protein
MSSNVRKGKYKLCKLEKLCFEPIIGCKHPIIASGATLIGSTGPAPDRKIIRMKIMIKNSKKL